jgi:hypothetical protein
VKHKGMSEKAPVPYFWKMACFGEPMGLVAQKGLKK